MLESTVTADPAAVTVSNEPSAERGIEGERTFVSFDALVVPLTFLPF